MKSWVPIVWVLCIVLGSCASDQSVETEGPEIPVDSLTFSPDLPQAVPETGLPGGAVGIADGEIAMIDPHWSAGVFYDTETHEPVEATRRAPIGVLSAAGDLRPLPVPPPLGSILLVPFGDTALLAGWRCVDEPGPEEACVERFEAAELSPGLDAWEPLDVATPQDQYEPDFAPIATDGTAHAFSSGGKTYAVLGDQFGPLPDEGVPADGLSRRMCVADSTVVTLLVDHNEDAPSAVGDVFSAAEIVGVRLLDLSAGEWRWEDGPTPPRDTPITYTVGCMSGRLLALGPGTESAFDPVTQEWTSRSVELPPAVYSDGFNHFRGSAVSGDDAAFVSTDSGLVRRSLDGEWSLVDVPAGQLTARSGAPVLVDRSSFEVTELP